MIKVTRVVLLLLKISWPRESDGERERERERAKEGDSSAWAGALMHQNNQLQLPCYACH